MKLFTSFFIHANILLFDHDIYLKLQLLRTMLSKKIYPQNASRASSMKRYLEDRPKTRTEKDEDESQEEKRQESCKWVKTDSECKSINRS